MRASIWVDPWCWVLGAFLLLLVPLQWVLAAVLAALIHEGCHVLAIFLCGCHVLSIRVSVGRTVIETNVSDDLRELLCAMAGPVGSLLATALCRPFPELALCAGVQGLFNLMPVYPLDGGRAVRCGLMMLFPKWAPQIEKGICLLFFLILAVRIFLI